MKDFAKKIGYMVADVRCLVDIELPHRNIKKGDIVTVSNLDHPKDVKLWANCQAQCKAEWFDLKNPIWIIRGEGDNILNKPS